MTSERVSNERLANFTTPSSQTRGPTMQECIDMARELQSLRSAREAEPVGWVRQSTLDKLKAMHSGATNTQIANVKFPPVGCVVPVYLHPDTSTEADRLAKALREIMAACANGQVCDDVAWFGPAETLFDFCARTLGDRLSQEEYQFMLNDGVSE